jgi:hypothetical protein
MKRRISNFLELFKKKKMPEGVFSLESYPKVDKAFRELLEFVDRQPNKYILSNYVDIDNVNPNNSYCLIAVVGEKSMDFYETLRKVGVLPDEGVN